MYHLAKAIYLHATSLPEYSILLLGLDGAGKTTLLNQIKNMYGGTQGESRLSAGSRGEGQPSETAGKTVPTVGQNVITVQLPNAYLRIWDIGGQQSLRNLWAKYYSSCHAIVFVVDSTDVGDGSLAHLRATADSSQPRIGRTASAPGIRQLSESDAFGRLSECAQVLQQVLGDSGTSGVPLLVLANKQDREDSVEVVRIKEGFVRRVVEGEGLERAPGDGGEAEDGDEESGRRGMGGYVRDSRVLPCSALNGQGVQEAVDWLNTRVGWNKEARPPVMR